MDTSLNIEMLDLIERHPFILKVGILCVVILAIYIICKRCFGRADQYDENRNQGIRRQEESGLTRSIGLTTTKRVEASCEQIQPVSL